MSTSALGSFATSVAQIAMFILLVWWVAIIKVTTSIMTFIFGPEYKQTLFGQNIRNTEFSLSRNITFVNHGSYGCVPKVVQGEQRKLRDEMESCPDKFFLLKIQEMWYNNIALVAKFVNSDPKNLVFLNNTTTGINSVLKTVQLDEGQSILVTNQTYGAVHMTAQEVCTAKNCNLVVLNMTFPISDLDGSAEFYVGDIVEQYRNVLENNPNIRLAVIDYITSSSAVKLPIKKLIQVCRQHNVLVLIDGAHAPGQIQLDLESLDADFFVGNLHKWLYTPRGCAILWVHPKYHDIINPLVVSWNQDGDFQEKFWQQGTLDYTAYLSVEAALNFYQEMGGMEAITAYSKRLVSWASVMLSSEWRTEVLPVPDSMKAPFMACIRLPSDFQTIFGTSQRAQESVKKTLIKNYKTVVAISCVQSSLWCRISANLYNTKEDYVRLGNAVNRMRQDLISGELVPDVSVIGDSIGPSPAQSMNVLNH